MNTAPIDDGLMEESRIYTDSGDCLLFTSPPVPLSEFGEGESAGNVGECDYQESVLDLEQPIIGNTGSTKWVLLDPFIILHDLLQLMRHQQFQMPAWAVTTFQAAYEMQITTTCYESS